ncbi:MAG: hypothetical protein IKC69_02650 [Clostridia bacterium]|nr:hypothetical protein [Clostridia bacterium]
MKKGYAYVNDFAPRDGLLSVYFKKFSGKKSDGFAFVFDGEVYVVDVGGPTDPEMSRFLSTLRETWLESAPEDVDRDSARLAFSMIVSHSHPDHIGALPGILSDPRFCLKRILAPRRCYRSLEGPDLLPSLKKYEDNLCAILPLLTEYDHVAREIERVEYGKVYPVRPEKGDVIFDLFPAPYDWSEDRGSDEEGFQNLVLTTTTHSATYLSNPEAGWANGVMNGNSLWVRAIKGKQTVLITGDQRATEQMLGHMIRYYGDEEFCCDVLKMPHHGEKNYPPHLVKIAAPSITVITLSRARSTPETCELCERVSKLYYMEDGNLLLTLDGKDSIQEMLYE